MSTTYTTTINKMYTVPNPTGYVVNVLFNVSGTDGTYTANIDGNIQFAPEQDQVDFIPYANLTEAIVMGWINTATNNQENYYANVQGQINSMITPPVSPTSEPLPWSA
jgi:type 1 glutamine amidotransferase